MKMWQLVNSAHPTLAHVAHVPSLPTTLCVKVTDNQKRPRRRRHGISKTSRQPWKERATSTGSVSTSVSSMTLQGNKKWTRGPCKRHTLPPLQQRLAHCCRHCKEYSNLCRHAQNLGAHLHMEPVTRSINKDKTSQPESEPSHCSYPPKMCQPLQNARTFSHLVWNQQVLAYQGGASTSSREK